jgi:hypothetical protein
VDEQEKGVKSNLRLQVESMGGPFPLNEMTVAFECAVLWFKQ